MRAGHVTHVTRSAQLASRWVSARNPTRSWDVSRAGRRPRSGGGVSRSGRTAQGWRRPRAGDGARVQGAARRPATPTGSQGGGRRGGTAAAQGRRACPCHRPDRVRRGAFRRAPAPPRGGAARAAHRTCASPSSAPDGLRLSPDGRSGSRGTPWRCPPFATSSSGSASASQAMSESAPRLRCTTRCAAPSSVSRGSQNSSRSCSACLPILIGGFDQSAANRTSSGTCSGVTGTHVLAPEPRRVLAGQLQRPLVDVDRPHRRPGRVQRHRQRERSPAAAEVEQVALGRRRGRLAQQHPGAEVDVAAAEDPGGRHHLDLAAGEPHLERASLVRGARGVAEVVVGHARTVPGAPTRPGICSPARSLCVMVGRPTRRDAARRPCSTSPGDL